MIEIIDDVIPINYSDKIIDLCNKSKYEFGEQTSGWYNAEHRKLLPVNHNTYDKGQYTSTIFQEDASLNYNQPLFYFFQPVLLIVEDILKSFKINKFIRIKCNILTQAEEFPVDHYNIVHTDGKTPNLVSVIYYCNDSDGDTFLFNEIYNPEKITTELNVAKRITPKKNRVVIFDSMRYHASSNPTVNQSRMVINSVLEVDK